MLTDKVKVLLLAPRFPYPALGGDKVFLMNVAAALRGCHLTLLSLCSTREEMELEPGDDTFDEIHKVYLSKWASYRNVLAALPGRTPLQLAYYRSREFRKKLERLLPQHDIVIAHLIRTGQYLAGCGHGAPSVLLMVDAISLTYQRMIELSGAPPLWHFLYRAEFRRLYSYERSCTRTVDQTWLVSEVDRRFLGLNPDTLRIMPVGIDLEEFPFNPACSGNVVAFIANMSSSLNLDACRYFVREIFPSVRKAADIRFRVIGACPASVRKELEGHAGVEVTGTVKRIADAVDGVFCGVCPVRGGAGIQNKVLNYLALGIPCVTSRIGLEGLSAVDGRDLLVYQEPGEAVDLMLRLYGDSSLRTELAACGRKFVEKNHDWRMIHRSMRTEVAELLAKRATSAET